MQSSLSYTHANAFNFQQNLKPRSTYPITINPQQNLSHSFSKSVSQSLQSSSPRQFLKSRFEIHQTDPPLNQRSPSTLAPLRCGISSNSISANNNDNNKKSFRHWVEAIGDGLSNGFPIWVSLGCLFGLLNPSSFNWVTPGWNIIGLTLTMLGMGMTLTLEDLRGAVAMPKEIISGFFSSVFGLFSIFILYVSVGFVILSMCYSYGCKNRPPWQFMRPVRFSAQVMPLSAFFVSKLLNLPSHYAAGLILVGCCPGGTASNIVTYLARGNVALSVLMTATSTFTAVIMTPYLTAKLAGQYVAVDAASLFMSTLQVVLLPVLAGAFINQYFQSFVKFVSPVMPPIAVGTVAVLCGNAIAQSASAILMSGRQVVLACCLLHIAGFSFGYLFSRILGIDVASSRTISIEVGMQNSVLGVVLATQHFGNPLTVVPCAVSSVAHSIIGSLLAGVWRYTTPNTNITEDNNDLKVVLD